MQLKENSSDNKLKGAYYTPETLAKAVVDKLRQRDVTSVLEPSCGEGVFLDKVAKKYTNSSITAVEIDEDAANKAQQKYKNQENITVTCADFFDFYDEVKNTRKFDLIIGNPPYIRYQYLTEKQRKLQSEILTSNGMKSNKLINAWVAFLVACVNMLSFGGTIAFVIPAELLQVAYAEDLRIFLTRELDNITVVTFKELVFSNVQQETVVFYGEKGRGNGSIRLVEVNDTKDFSQTNFDDIQFQQIENEKDKWTKYFISREDARLLEIIRNDERFKDFSDFGLINVGITTGNNNYFSITKEINEKYGLTKATLPLIGRSSHVKGIYYTQNDWEQNLEDGKRAMLLSFPDSDFNDYPNGYKEYIKLGEDKKVNEGYKCKIRDRWYIIPSVWVPDAFFLRRNHLYPKFVLNQCGAVSTDTMHRIKFNSGVNPEDVLLGYYNSISFAFTEICGRSYGGGVLEILPREMGQIKLVDVSKIDSDVKKEALRYIDEVVRNGRNIEQALDTVDQLLTEYLEIPQDWFNNCRSIWKSMQQRRLKRGGKNE